MRLLRRSCLTAFIGLAVLASPAMALKAGYRTVVSGPVKATVTWTKGFGIVGDKPEVTITRAGQRLVDHRKLGPLCQLCTSIAVPRKSLHVRDLDGNGEREVLVDLYSGGAHCCSTTIIFVLRPNGRYHPLVASWGNAFYEVKDLDGNGTDELISGDDRFAGTFTDYAESADPPLVYGLLDGRLKDVTRAFPSQASDQITTLDHSIATAGKDGDRRGLIAARMADLALLGRSAEIDPYLGMALKRGWLNGESIWPSGAKYKPALLKYLRKWDYL